MGNIPMSFRPAAAAYIEGTPDTDKDIAFHSL